LTDVFENCPGLDERDARLTTLGRHFRLRPGIKVILGRDAEENARLEQMAGPLAVVSCTIHPGPTAVLQGTCEAADFAAVGRLLRRFTPKLTAEHVEFRLRHDGEETTWTAHDIATECEVHAWMIGKRDRT
jgi:hypothetical protein